MAATPFCGFLFTERYKRFYNFLFLNILISECKSTIIFLISNSRKYFFRCNIACFMATDCAVISIFVNLKNQQL